MQVKKRTSNFYNYDIGSHVMEYGSKNLTDEKLYLYQGFDPASVNFPPNNGQLEQYMEVVNQRDAEIFFMWQLVSSSLRLFFSQMHTNKNQLNLLYIFGSIILILGSNTAGKLQN